MCAILKKELKMYYSSLFAYLYYGMFFLITAVFFVVNCLGTYSTHFGYYVMRYSFFVVVAVIPFCTMRLLAQERRSRTDQLLFTAPVSSFSVLAGKYLATAVYVLLPVALSVIYPVAISSCGEMSIRFVAGSYIGGCLLVLALLSVGMFISSLTTNVVLAAVFSYAVYGIILLERMIEAVLADHDMLYTFFHEISPYNKYFDMVSGIIRSGDVIFMLLIVICFFVLTWVSIESRRQDWRRIAAYAVAAIVLTVLLGTAFLRNTRVYDFTAEQLLTLSDETKERVSSISKPTDIYYMGARSRANATYRELMRAYMDLNENIEVHYVQLEDPVFRAQYLPDIWSVQEASMLVVCGERSIYLNSEDYIITTQTSSYSYQSILNIEEQLTRAILYTNSEVADKICVISGHGEESLNSDFTNLMRLNNYELKELNLSEQAAKLEQTFSDDYRAVLINSPQVDFSEEELDSLRSYLEAGGKLSVILDPLNEELDRLYAFLKEYGLEVQTGIVIESEQGRYLYDTPNYIIPQMEDNKYTADIVNKHLDVLTMTSKGILKGGSANGYVCTDILTTSASSFSKVTDFDNLTTKAEGDINGPFSVASCASNPEEGSLLLITSNILFNQEADAESSGANRRFFVEILQKLTGTQSTVWIEGKDVGSQTAFYPNTVQGMIKVVTIIVIPVCILLIGVVVLVLRQKNIGILLLKKRYGDKQITDAEGINEEEEVKEDDEKNEEQ
ncbi:MAG: Gldg family protein [Lachnospiraceae bacterium]|nr:Gldg family protein [Lachnospiraceae bacterium]